jgi:uncharacterized protein YfiM (DUF2279 family)
MKKILTLGVTVLLTTSAIAQIHQDKVNHLLAGAFISVGTTEFLYQFTHDKNKSILIGIGAGCLAGASKEMYDLRTGKGQYEAKDFLWTCAGASITSLKLTVRL